MTIDEKIAAAKQRIIDLKKLISYWKNYETKKN